MNKPIKIQLGTIDLLRGVAVLLVLFTHWSTYWDYTLFLVRHSWIDKILSFFSFTIHIGSIHPGVLIFIVLSGFIIHLTTSYTPRNNLSFFKNYIEKRFLRIFPIYFLALILGLLLSLRLGSEFQSSFSAFLKNVFFLYGIIPTDLPPGNQIMVTVAVEMWLYFSYGIFRPYLNNKKRWGAVLLLGFFLSLINFFANIYKQHFDYWSYHNFYSFFILWYVGAGFAELALRNIKLNSYWILLIYFTILSQQYFLFFKELTLVVYISLGIVIGALLCNYYNRPVREVVITYIGRAGYSIYAFHIIIFTVFSKTLLGQEQ